MSELSKRYDAAIELQQSGKLDQAIEALEAIVADDPDYALAHAALAKYFSDLGNHDKAIDHAMRVCVLEPEDPFSFTALSMLAIKADDREKAEDALAQARQLQIVAQMQKAQPPEDDSDDDGGDNGGGCDCGCDC